MAARPRLTRFFTGRTALAAIAISACIAHSAHADIHDRAVPILDRYLAATGGRVARETERTLHVKGKIRSEGLIGRWELWTAAPDRWMRKFTLGPLKFREGFDGTTAWRTDLNDKSVSAISEIEADRAREDGWFLNERFVLEDQGGGNVRVGSRVFKENVTFDQLVVTSPEGHTRRMFVSEKTGFIDRIVTEGDHQSYEERLEDYKTLAGRMRPSAYSSPTLLPGDKPFERMTVDSVWVNEPMDSSRFAMPNVAARTIAWQKTSSAITVPFVYGSKAVLVKVSLNGLPPEDFLLDTGASFTAIDRDWAESHGLKPVGDSYVQGIAGVGEMKFARVTSLALTGSKAANATLKDFRVALLDLSEGMQMMLWRKPAGILGADFLSRFVVDIDYDAQVVTLYDPATFTYKGKGTPIAFQLWGNVPAIECTLDDGCSGTFIVDVGNSFAFTVHGSLVRKCKMIGGGRKRREVEVMGGGIGGGFVSTLCRLDSLRIGPYVCTEPVAALALHNSGGIGSKDIAGNVGNSVLERFHCTFDYGNKILYLEPGKRFAEREKVSRFGALFARLGERVLAGNILSGSAAYDAGLRWFDEIVAVDGKPLTNWTREQVDRVLEEGEAGSVHKVTYKRMDLPNKTVEVKLKDVL